MGHEVLGKVNDRFKLARRHIKQQREFGGGAAEKPRMHHGRCKGQMPHTFSAHLGLRDFHTALITNDPAVPDAFVFSAVTFPVFSRPKNFFRKQSVFFRLQRPVVNRFGLGHFSVRPTLDIPWRREDQTKTVKFGQVSGHDFFSVFISSETSVLFASSITSLASFTAVSTTPSSFFRLAKIAT